MRIIIDTNIFVSGLLGSPSCRKIYSLFKENKFILIISEILFEELKFVIERPKFHLLIDNEERKEVILFIKYRAIFIKPEEKINICRDIKDNKILECALKAKANLIVTGDKDLLTLKTFRGIPIIKPKDFIKELEK